MCNQDGFLRDLKGIESGAVTAMRDVDGHSDLVHAFDDRNTNVRNPFVPSFRRSITDKIAAVISELRNALAQTAKEIDVIRTTEVFRILEAQHDADLPGLLNALQIGHAIDAHEIIAAIRNKAIPTREVLQGIFISIGTTHANRLMKNADAGFGVRLQIRGLE